MAEAVAAYGRAAVDEAVATAGLAATAAIGVAEATVGRGAALAETRDGKPSPPVLLELTEATAATLAGWAATAATLAGWAATAATLAGWAATAATLAGWASTEAILAG